VAFWELFQAHADGSISPKVRVTVGGISFAPRVAIPGSLMLGGERLVDLAGRDLMVERGPEGVVVVGVVGTG